VSPLRSWIIGLLVVVATSCGGSPDAGPVRADPDGPPPSSTGSSTAIDCPTSTATPDPTTTGAPPATGEAPTAGPSVPDPDLCVDTDDPTLRALVEALIADRPLPTDLDWPATTTRVLAVGDSLLAESHRYLVPIGRAHGIGLTVEAVGGTAPCDWTAVVPALVATEQPDVVVFSFSGNALFECMADAPVGSAAYYDRYRRDAGELTDDADAGGAEVWWTEILPMARPADERARARLRDLYSDLAATAGTVPTRWLFSTGEGGFGTDLPCRFAWEPCDEVKVRSEDGIHLGTTEGSPYGAVRYALAIVDLAVCRANEECPP
jgi:hypothetical protein